MASQYPQVEEIINRLNDKIGASFEHLKSSPACHFKGQQYKDFVQLLLLSHNTFTDLPEWDEFKSTIHVAMTNGLQTTRFLLPSSLVSNLQKNAELLLSDIQTRQHLSNLFQVFVPSLDEEIFHFYFADYVLYLVSYIIQFVSECVRRSVPASQVIETGREIMDTDYLETVYYVGGAKLYAIDKKSKLYPKDKGWKNIGRVIHERLIESDTVPGPPAYVKGWTNAQNRGKLLYISGLLFDFFCGVVIVLEKQALKKRVDYPDVIEKVCQSGLVLLWDEAVGDSMTENESFKFMNCLIESFCQTFTVGKAQKLVNSIRKKGEAALPLRARVAPKTSSEKSTTAK